MDVFEAVKKRRSIRRFKRIAVEQEKLNMVLQAARLSPSAANRQPWRFIVVIEEKVKKKIKSAYNADWLVQAPAIIVACAVPKEAWCRVDGEEYWKVDVAIALQDLILVATQLGLGTCWIANFNEEEVKRALAIPRDWRVVAMTPLGYPDEEKESVRNRKPMQDIIRFRI